MPSRRRVLRACAAAGLAGVAGCIDDPGDDPTTTLDDGETETRSPTATPTMHRHTTDPPTRTGTDRIAWERTLPGTVSHRPVLAGETLFVGSDDGTVTALGAADGSQRWRFGTDWPVQATPTVADEVVLAVSGRDGLGDHHTVHALDAASGEQRWSFAPGEWWLDVLGTTTDRAFVATTDDAIAPSGQTLYALSLADGAVQWSVDVGDNSGGLVTDETVYVPATTVVDAVAVDGSERWRYEGAEYQFRTLSVASDTVAFATGSSPAEWTIRGLDAVTGEQRWTFDDWVAYTTRTDGDRLLVGGEKVARLDPASGAVEWTADQRAALYDAPVADDTLYVAGERAAAIDVDDGTVHWRTPLDAHIASPAGLAGGRLLVHESTSRDDRNRHVRALDAEDGEQVWRFTGAAALTRPTVGSERGYVGEDSDLLALRG